MLTLATVAAAPVFGGRVVLRCPRGPAHHYAFVVDELRRLRVPVLVALQATAGVTLDLEGLGIAVLLVRAVLLAALFPPSEHVSILPDRR